MPSVKSPRELRLRENQLFLALSILVGVLAGLSAVLFALAIERLSRVLFGIDPTAARFFLVPISVSLVTGFMLVRWFPDARGSGVPQTEAAFHLRRGQIPGRVAIGKFVTGVLCVGSGHSMGREGPSVQIGAAIASTVGRWSGVSADRVKALVPVGTAGALAAAFNTPVAAVLFSLEEVIGDMNASLIGSTVVASVASVVVERAILGNEPLFHVPPYQLVHPGELAAYAVLGSVGGVVSFLFSGGLLAARAAFKRLPRRTAIVQPAIGSALLGVLLVIRPEILGVGYQYVGEALNGSMLVRTMAVLCVLKLAATIVSYASGNAGGIFGPTLFLGAMLGGVVGTLVHQFAPFPTAGAGAYALVGMGALFAGVIRAPMTSVFMVFEITQDYQILVPLMVANLLSYVIARRFQPTPVYHALLHQDGVHLPTAGGVETHRTWSVRDVMAPSVTLMAPHVSIGSALPVMEAAHVNALLVGYDHQLAGVVTRSLILDACSRGGESDPLSTIVVAPTVHVHPDHGMDVLFERWHKADGVLPVVAREDVRCVEGIVTLEDITRYLSSPDLGDLSEKDTFNQPTAIP
jgi:CIC family chloride channel protein